MLTIVLGGPMSSMAQDEISIINPYFSVDWATYGQYKANFHSHSVESDGGNQPEEMFEDHYAKDFDIMALTDHNFTNTTWDRTDRPTNIIYLTSARMAEINAGTDRGGRGMIGIPFTNEQSVSDHLNTFWADFNNVSGDTLERKIAKAETLGGISHINHPGRYTGGSNTANDGADGELASSLSATIAKYTYLFGTYGTCVGMEIINKKDGDSYSDRILWDNILKQTMPDRPVWGFSNDDSHSTGATGFSYNILLLPENTTENVRYGMENGTFYAVAKVSKRELGSGFVANGPTPVITNVAVDETADSITIAGDYYDTIEWIANGRIIATGSTIYLASYSDQISSYVRAQLKGAGGISFTQPFGVIGLEKDVELALVDMAASSDTISAETPSEIVLSLTAKDNTNADMDLNGAEIEYLTNQPNYISVDGGTVSLKNAPASTIKANVWAKVTVGASTMFSNIVEISVDVQTNSNPGEYIASPIASGSDDVEEFQDGTLYTDSSDLEITLEDASTNQLIGLRFTDISIPKGATVTGAYIQFSVDEAKTIDPFNVDIYAEASSDSAPFANSNLVSSRIMSGAFVNWSDIPAWSTVHETGKNQQTPDLTALVQEIVDMEGWAEGNAISIILSGTGQRCAESYEGAGNNTEQIPTLYYSYTVEPEGTKIVTPVGSALDDMEERPDGSLDWDSSDLEITEENDSNNQVIGLRFSDLSIPKGATITGAHIQLSVDEPNKSSDYFDVNIYAEATTNSAPFENAPYTVSSRTKTSTFVNWTDIPKWTVEHEAGANQQTPDLAALVQEIVDQDGWSEGNAVSFILSGYGTRSAESFEGSKGNAEQIPTLYLWYTKPADDTPPVIAVNIEDGDVLEKISEFDLICEATDEQSGIATFEVYLDNAAIEPHSILMLESMAFGEHQLVLVATDNAGNETMIQLKFVINASIDTLVWLLENYYEDGYITNHGIFNSLKKKVEKGHLNAFINQLHAKGGKKHIDREQLMILLEYAEYFK
jgi:hypothetical protein